MADNKNTIILGAGVTGLSAGVSSGLPIFEANMEAGGICTSYYMKVGSDKKMFERSKSEDDYRFELGGGHWIFGGDKPTLNFIENMVSTKRYSRKSSVFFKDKNLFIPYPLQNNLRFLDKKIIWKALSEMMNGRLSESEIKTMSEAHLKQFGQILYELFFKPFHEMYTAGLYQKIAPQDSYKTPVNMELAVRGAFIDSDDIGYNTTFIYPKNGLNCLINKMVECSDVHFGKKVVKIDTKNKKIYFSDETTIAYDRIISTLPLNKMLELTGIKLREKSSPSPGVLVVNIGATKGKKCPKDHWVYIPKSRAGFHRVGFYSNVDQSFLPKTKRDKGTHVSIYVEKAFVEGHKPSLSEISKLTKEITKELKEWQWIKKVEVNDPTWVETAYTWSWPNSVWSEHALKELEMVEIQQVGRYGKWIFQGIAESIRDGLAVGAKYKK